MHVRHEALFRWLMRALPRHAGSTAPTTTAAAPTTSGWRAGGARAGRPAAARGELSIDGLDAHAAERLEAMRERYAALHRARAEPRCAAGRRSDPAGASRHRGAAGRRSPRSPSDTGCRRPRRPELASLLDLLAEDPLAPTAVRDPRRRSTTIWPTRWSRSSSTRSAARAPSRTSARAPGFPGLPLAIALPARSFALVESAARKCAFLERAVGACGLDERERRPRARRGVGRGARPLRPRDGARARAARRGRRVRGAAAPDRGHARRVARPARPGGARRPRRAAAAQLGLEPAEIRRVQPYPAAPSTGTCTSCRRLRRPRPASRAGRDRAKAATRSWTRDRPARAV